MITPYLNLEKLGIEGFVFHSIRAFCPQPSALLKLQERCRAPDDKNADGFWTHKLHERPIFKMHQWESPQAGFAPTLTIGKSTASLALPLKKNEPTMLARLLRQGVGILTKVEDTKDEAILVEPVPGVPKTGSKNGSEAVLRKFATKIGITVNQLVMPRNGDRAAQLMLEDTSYEVTEVVFQTREDLLRLTDYENKDDDIERLRYAVAYFLARSYDLGVQRRAASRSLQRVVEELRSQELYPLVEQVNGGLQLRNLSQSIRGFVTLGPRGAVLAHAKDFAHPRFRVSALNMIEILRGRHFNMIVARTFADDTIRDLSKLAHLDQLGNYYGSASSQVDHPAN